ncbi:MAG: hypothetical protein GY932_02105, partial [Arcobacter sp.]|nr:hypothetical protein [Arcobacter sp.]
MKELSHPTNGIYKKPKSDLLYVATSHSLLEINSDSIKILKKIIDYDALSYYPLHIGDKWFYNVKRIGVWQPTETTYNLIRQVVKDTIMSNSKKYFQISESRSDTNIIQYCYERIDSLNAKIFKYDELFNNGKEFVIEDLSLEQNDSFLAWKDYSVGYYEGIIHFLNITFQQIFDYQPLIKETKFYQS